MNTEMIQIIPTLVVVDDEPYCAWEVDMAKNNADFLQGIDVNYFQYVLKTNLSSDDEKRASICLKMTYYHALETMFSLLAAFVQAPDCVYVWLSKCSNSQLRRIVARIDNHDSSLFNKLDKSQVSWEAIAMSVFRWFMPGTEKSDDTTKLFSRLWQRLAHEFMQEDCANEYNSLKHGLRVKPGGFKLSVGPGHNDGLPTPDNQTKVIGESKYGTAFYSIESIQGRKGDRNLVTRRIFLNWTIEKIAPLIELMAMSVANIRSALEIVNGAKPELKKFVRPIEDEDFEKPWSCLPGVTRVSESLSIQTEAIPCITRADLMEEIAKFRSR